MMKSIRSVLVATLFLFFGLSPAMAAVLAVGSTSWSATDNGNALRDAVKSAQPGDTLLLAPGAYFEGPFQLISTAGSYITICSGTVTSGCFQTADRVRPADANQMAKLVTPSSGNAGSSAITTGKSAGYYRLTGVEITTSYYVYNLILLGTATENSWQQLPHHIIFDRCFVHGSYANGTRRGVAANAGQGTTATSGNPGNNASAPQDDIVITNSYFADFKDPGADSQAIAAWNGYGPFRFENNYFEAAGENVMFGGADPSIRNLVPSDIKVLRNHFYKPLDWYSGTQAGRLWVKNLFELKNAQNVLIDGNVFEHNWVNQQNGMGILFTPRNQNGRSSWSVVQSVTFTNNVVRHSAGGINILGYDDIHRSQQLNHVTIRNNLFLDITDGIWGTSSAAGRLFSVENKTDHVTIDHNTAFQSKAITYSWDRANTNFVFTANVVRHNTCAGDNHNCGMSGDSASTGIDALNKYFVNPLVQYNEMYGNAESWPYPSPNDFADASAVSFDEYYVMTSPIYTDANFLPVGIDSSVMANSTAGVVQYCTSSGVSCSVNP